MTQRLTDMTLTRVSLVDKGANARRLAVLKRDEEEPMSDQIAAAIAKVGEQDRGRFAGFVEKLAALFLPGEPVAKVATFAEIVSGQELRDALYDSWYTLEDALGSAIYATDESGQALSLEAKKGYVAQDLDEFKAYLLAQMDTGISKQATPAELATRQVAAVVAKAGRKISGARLERLQSAAESLNGVLAEVVEVTEEAESAEEVPVEKAELVEAMTEAITKAQEPLIARIDAIEKRGTVVVNNAEVVKTGAEGEGDEPVTLEVIAEAVGKIGDRMTALETARGVRKSADGQEAGGEPVAKSMWAGVI